MPKFANFSSDQPSPSPVLGWYDTDLIDYPTPPPTEDMLPLTDEQWAHRMEGFWAVDNGALVAYTPPPPPLSPDGEYVTRVADGIAITSTATSALDATYPIDPASMALIGAAARDAASGLGLPHGLPTMPVTDVDGTAHDFSEPAIIATYKASRDLVYVMGQQRDIMAGGGTPTWPPQTATIP